MNQDADSDGLTNAVEVAFGSNPHDADSDDGGKTDYQEYHSRAQTNPNNAHDDDPSPPWGYSHEAQELEVTVAPDPQWNSTVVVTIDRRESSVFRRGDETQSLNERVSPVTVTATATAGMWVSIGAFAGLPMPGPGDDWEVISGDLKASTSVAASITGKMENREFKVKTSVTGEALKIEGEVKWVLGVEHRLASFEYPFFGVIDGVSPETTLFTLPDPQ